MEITAKSMSSAIVTRCQTFKPRNNFLIIENLSWGFFDWGECDLLIISKSFYASEVEIKISISDLKADFKKKKWNGEFNKSHMDKIRNFYYAVPVAISEEAKLIIESKNANAGLVVVDFRDNDRGLSLCPLVKIVKRPTPTGARKLTDVEVLNISRLAMFRYWRSK